MDAEKKYNDRIRQDIFKFINEQYPEAWKAKKAKMLAWLEQKKESLHIPETSKENADSFTEEDEKIRIELLKDIPKVFPYEKAFRYIHWLEKTQWKH